MATRGRSSNFGLLRVPKAVPQPCEFLVRSRVRMGCIVAARIARGPSEPPDRLHLMRAGYPASGETFNRLMVRNSGALLARHEPPRRRWPGALYLLAFDIRVRA